VYSKAFKALMVRKMIDPSGPGATALAEVIGVSISTFYRWVSETGTVDVANVPDPPSFRADFFIE
jgi:transposase-like protein